MKSPWSYAEAPLIEDVIPFCGVRAYPSDNQKSFRDLIRYIEIMDDILKQPITDRQRMKGDNYIGELR